MAKASSWAPAPASCTTTTTTSTSTRPSLTSRTSRKGFPTAPPPSRPALSCLPSVLTMPLPSSCIPRGRRRPVMPTSPTPPRLFSICSRPRLPTPRRRPPWRASSSDSHRNRRSSACRTPPRVPSHSNRAASAARCLRRPHNKASQTPCHNKRSWAAGTRPWA